MRLLQYVKRWHTHPLLVMKGLNDGKAKVRLLECKVFRLWSDRSIFQVSQEDPSKMFKQHLPAIGRIYECSRLTPHVRRFRKNFQLVHVSPLQRWMQTSARQFSFPDVSSVRSIRQICREFTQIDVLIRSWGVLIYRKYLISNIQRAIAPGTRPFKF